MVYVSYAKRDLIGVYDAISGKLENTWAVPAPSALAARPDGSPRGDQRRQARIGGE